MREDFQAVPVQNFDGILALGNEALFVVLGHSGIMKWRGKIEHYKDVPVIASVALPAVERNPSQGAMLQADINALQRAITGEVVENALPESIRVARNATGLKDLALELRKAAVVAFDLETSGFDEFAPGAFIVSLALTLELHDGSTTCWAVPLRHSASPWDKAWQNCVKFVAKEMNKVPIRIGHNAKFDCRWLAHFDAAVPSNFDTMLAAHLLDENRPKSLKTLAQLLLGAPEWAIEIKSGKNAPPWYEQYPLKQILKYNALDTWHTYHLYKRFVKQLESDYRLRTLFDKLVMPASQSLVHIERGGVYVDQKKLNESAVLVRSELDRIEGELGTYLPKAVPYPVNWNPSLFLRWFLFDYLKYPVLSQGKSGPSTAEDVMTKLAVMEDLEYRRVAELLVERVKWQKFNSSFIIPYMELVDDHSRIRTTFKLAGTVTGRLSSGKADGDKITGSRSATLRGCNLQQVPRDPIIRGVFGARPGWLFVEADYSQVELRIAAEIAQEPTMLSLYSRGEDIHMAMAIRMLGKPASEITPHERKMAKAVNFGFLYGMGWRKFIETAWNNYGLLVSEEEAKLFRKAFFTQFPELIHWHARQRRLAHKYRRVQSPLGRIRHLPDISSPDSNVVAEAERQAINSPVQAMASDLCLLSLNLLHRKFLRAGYRTSLIGTVHDAINFEVPEDELLDVLPMIKKTMEAPPTRQLFNYDIRVPIVADIAVGTHWGHKEEIPAIVIQTPSELRSWLDARH